MSAAGVCYINSGGYADRKGYIYEGILYYCKCSNNMCKDVLQKLIDLGLVLQTQCQSQEVVTYILEVTQLGRPTFIDSNINVGETLSFVDIV